MFKYIKVWLRCLKLLTNLEGLKNALTIMVIHRKVRTTKELLELEVTLRCIIK